MEWKTEELQNDKRKNGTVAPFEKVLLGMMSSL